MSVYGDAARRQREERTCKQHILYRTGPGDDSRTDDWRSSVWRSRHPPVLSGADGDDAAGWSCVSGFRKKAERQFAIDVNIMRE